MKIIRPAKIVDRGTAFSRSSTATMYDKTGALVTVAANVPRFSYDPSDLTKPPALLMDAGDVFGNNLTSLTPEDDAALWDAGSLYVQGEKVLSATTHRVYESNTGTSGSATMVTSSYVTWIAHGVQVGWAFKFLSGAAPSGLATGVVYFVQSIIDADNIRLSATRGGAPLSWPFNSQILPVRCTPNYAVDPASAGSSEMWLDAGADRKYAMFDESIESLSHNPDELSFAFVTPGSVFVDSVLLQNVSAAKVRVIAIYPAEGVVYDRTVDMVAPLDSSDIYSYLFEPPVRKTDVLFKGLPPYANMIISVSLVDKGNNASLGLCVAGQSKVFGPTQAGMSLGNQDYSVKGKDDYGYTVIQERAFAKTMTLTAFVDRRATNNLINLLNSLRATPIVYIGDDSMEASFLYGFYKDYSMGADYPEHSVLHIEIESLT